MPVSPAYPDITEPISSLPEAHRSNVQFLPPANGAPDAYDVIVNNRRWGQMVHFTENNGTIWLYTTALNVGGECWTSAGYADRDEAEQDLAAVVTHARDYAELHPPAPGESNAPAAPESGSRIIHCQYQGHTLPVLCELIHDRVIRLTIAPYHSRRLPNTAYSLV